SAGRCAGLLTLRAGVLRWRSSRVPAGRSDPCFQRCFMSVARTAAAVAILLASWPAAALPAADQDALIRAKALYTSAAYDEALALLDGPDAIAGPDAIEAKQYRAFCLLALGRADDARKVIQEIVEADPSFQPSDAQMSPRLQGAF